MPEQPASGGPGDVTVTLEEGVAFVTLERPAKLNALSRHMEERLLAVLEGPEVAQSGCVVLAGSGRAFSAGADLNDFEDAGADDLLENLAASGRVYECFGTLAQPTVASISGYCIGGGLEMALGADLRIADETAVFDLPEVGYGIVTAGAAYRLTRIVGTARAKELLLFRHRFPASEALALGIVSEVVAPGELRERTRDLARAAAALPREAARQAKALVDRVADAPRDVAVALEQATYVALSQTAASRGNLRMAT